MDWRVRDRLSIYAAGAAVLLITAFVYAHYFQPEWMWYQSDFRELVGGSFGAGRGRQVARGVQQVWVPDLGRVDRCITCHQGYEWRGLENAEQPLRSHPRQILEQHPVARYGCTVCHGGQGWATTAETAHAVTEPHWEEPLLGAALSQVYLIGDPGALMEVNCNRCHRYDRETNGMEYINYAKQLVQQKGCRACHKINGRGGVIGPDLTYEGEQNPEQFDYSRMAGKPSVFGWHTAHFKDPKSMVSWTVMPNFGFGSREAHALTLLVMSWRRAGVPAAYVPGAKIGDFATPAELEKEKQMLTGRGSFFVRKGCFICHEVSVFGIESASKIGPDLAIAYADVQSRFGKTLEDFLKNPVGTMAVVLSTQIQLTDAERQQAVDLLKEAYQEKTQQEKTQAGAKP